MYSPPRQLSTMLVHTPNPPNPEPASRAVNLFIAHHDGDVGHPPADPEGEQHASSPTSTNVAENAQAKWRERLYNGAAGARMAREEAFNFGPTACSKESNASQELSSSPRTELPELSRFKPRMGARQLKDAEEARRHFAKARAEMDRIRTVGAASEKFATKPGFFNIIYSHPLFGAMPKWGGQTWVPPPGPLTPRAPLPLPKVKTRKVPASTEPWVRLPPHTAHQKAKYEAMYGDSGMRSGI
jgi:hypothetical protein